MFRYLLYFLLFFAVLVHLVSNSFANSEEIILCFDELQSSDYSSMYKDPNNKKYIPLICAKEAEAIYLYDLCYRQVNSTNENASFISKLSYFLADFFRPELLAPYSYVEEHNINCTNQPQYLINDINPII